MYVYVVTSHGLQPPPPIAKTSAHMFTAFMFTAFNISIANNTSTISNSNTICQISFAYTVN